MGKRLLTVLLVLAAGSTLAQKVTYNLPKSISNEQVRINFQKVSSSSSSYFINYKIENTGNGILIIDRGQTILEQNDGEVSPTSDRYILKSGDNKTVYNQFRVKPPVQVGANLLNLNFNSLSYVSPSTPVTATKLVLEDRATQVVNQFTVKVMEYNVYVDRVYAQLKCTYNGGIDSVGNIDLSELKVDGGEAEVVKKGDVVFSGKSYTFSINITPSGEECSVSFDKVFSVSKLQKIALDKIIIKSTDYVEPKDQDQTEGETKKEENETSKTAELSFNDFIALKKDIELEMNNGGKPVDMAYEFLLEKGGINTAQVIEVIAVFNLDGSRLKFAKMAYQFTSDKPKYHMVVGKLAYTKNKQALEEFLELQ